MKILSKRYEEIKNIVVNMFKKLDIKCIPISGFEIATKLKIKLVQYSTLSYEKFMTCMNISEDGFSVQLSDGSWIIYYNNFKSYRRINYTILHEIGHIVLDHKQASELAEKEANFFAKYALCPPPLIHRLKIHDMYEISEMFDISYEAAVYAWKYYQKWLRISEYTYVDLKILSQFNLI